MLHCPPPVEKPRGGLLHPNPVLGARSPDADPLRDPQHGAAATLLQPAQPGVQQQGQQPLRSCLHPQPRRRLLPQPQGGPQTGEPESLLESSSTEHRGDGGKRLSRGPYQDVRPHQGEGGGLTHNWSTLVKNLNLNIKEQGNTNGEKLFVHFLYL